jgi:hypothetical protein
MQEMKVMRRFEPNYLRFYNPLKLYFQALSTFASKFTKWYSTTIIGNVKIYQLVMEPKLHYQVTQLAQMQQEFIKQILQRTLHQQMLLQNKI